MNKILNVKIADNILSQQKGLMFVKSMPEDFGMLFKFDREQVLNFWGENTYIPLDIAFADKNFVIKKISKISPFSKKFVSSDLKCLFAIEANDGFFSKNKISPGDKFILNRDNDKYRVAFKSNGINKKSQIVGPDDQYVGPAIDSNEDEFNNQEDSDLPIIDTSNLNNILEDELEIKNNLEDQLQETGTEQQELQPEPDIEKEKEYPSFSNFFEASEWATSNHEIMRVTYKTIRGTVLQRQVEPHGSFYSESTKRRIIVTFDETVAGIRAFIMKNVSTFAFIGKKFDPKFRIS